MCRAGSTSSIEENCTCTVTVHPIVCYATLQYQSRQKAFQHQHSKLMRSRLRMPVTLRSAASLSKVFAIRLHLEADYTLGSIHDTRNGGCVLCPNPDLSGTNNHGGAGGQCRGSLHIVCPLLRCLLQFRQPVLTVPLHATDVLGQGTPRISRA